MALLWVVEWKCYANIWKLIKNIYLCIADRGVPHTHQPN